MQCVTRVSMGKRFSLHLSLLFPARCGAATSSTSFLERQRAMAQAMGPVPTYTHRRYRWSVLLNFLFRRSLGSPDYRLFEPYRCAICPATLKFNTACGNLNRYSSHVKVGCMLCTDDNVSSSYFFTDAILRADEELARVLVTKRKCARRLLTAPQHPPRSTGI